MTRTTAKKGMLYFKSGYGKDEFDYDFMEELAYNEKILFKHLVNKLNDADDKNEKAIVKLNDDVKELHKQCDSLQSELITTNQEVAKLRVAIEETMKGLITR